ncbi:MAG: (4Fe-4S)-binding protein [Candidatus Hecatellales archaeon]|nr:MAG: (4Fe-4S)-binding protein [Candidatus Hecatellales archaeon]
MKQVVVLSGKGGTGKTTLVASLTSLGKNLVVADCDVDAPDLHLLLKPEKLEFKEEFKGSKLALIDESKCVKCGLCEEHCRFDAIKNFRVNPILCEGCGVCAYVCPVKAVTLKEKVSGYVFVSRTRYGPLVHAKLEAAESNSGKLVTLVKNNAKNLALKEDKKLILVDGPPGIGCPVIASLGEVNLALVITEPTVSGLHDLQRILDLTGFFRIPAMVLINMYDLNLQKTEEIVGFCREAGVEAVEKIPFNPIVVEALTNGKPVVEYAPNSDVSEKIRRVWGRITSFLGLS